MVDQPTGSYRPPTRKPTSAMQGLDPADPHPSEQGDPYSRFGVGQLVGQTKEPYNDQR